MQEGRRAPKKDDPCRPPTTQGSGSEALGTVEHNRLINSPPGIFTPWPYYYCLIWSSSILSKTALTFHLGRGLCISLRSLLLLMPPFHLPSSHRALMPKSQSDAVQSAVESITAPDDATPGYSGLGKRRRSCWQAAERSRLDGRGGADLPESMVFPPW